MPAPQVPAILKKKLVFGDHEQIEALRNLEEANEKYYGDGTEKQYTVFIEVEYSETVTVLAGSEREAQQKAEDEFDTWGLLDDLDVSFHAEEDKPADC